MLSDFKLISWSRKKILKAALLGKERDKRDNNYRAKKFSIAATTILKGWEQQQRWRQQRQQQQQQQQEGPALDAKIFVFMVTFNESYEMGRSHGSR